MFKLKGSAIFVGAYASLLLVAGPVYAQECASQADMVAVSNAMTEAENGINQEEGNIASYPSSPLYMQIERTFYLQDSNCAEAGLLAGASPSDINDCRDAAEADRVAAHHNNILQFETARDDWQMLFSTALSDYTYLINLPSCPE